MRALVHGMCIDWGVSIRGACGALRLDTSTFHYKSRRTDQAAVERRMMERRIKEIAPTRVPYGYRRVHVLRRRKGWEINMKKTRRIYNDLVLHLGNLRAARVAITSQQPFFPTCYGREFISRDLDLWAYANHAALDFSRPGKPIDNGFIEAFNSKPRAECLNAHSFMSLADAREKLDASRRDHNEVRPHSAIGCNVQVAMHYPDGAASPPS